MKTKKCKMFIRIFSLILISSGFTIGQQTVGLFSNQSSSYNGYTLFNSMGSTTTYLIDNCGTKVYEWNSNYRPGASVYLLENGNLLRTNRLDSTAFTFGGAAGGIEILDPSSNVIWQYEVNTDSTLSHHDVEVLPNGNILILAIESISPQESNDNGSLVTAERWSEMILEINPTTDQIVWEWHAWDHLIQSSDSSLANYGIISDNPGKININYAFRKDGTDPDWMHANSLDYNSDLDQIIINSPHFKEFWILDHSTTTSEASNSLGGNSGKGGDILYRWGNPEAYNRGDSTDQVLEFQHDAHWIPAGFPDEGKIMIFNNGRRRKYSSIDIIEPPLDTSNFNNYFLTNNSDPYGPLNLYWSYSDSINFYSPIVSGSQQLQNGNILICSGSQARLFEIEQQTDSVVWEYIVPVNNNPIIQGTNSIGNLTFRTDRFSSSYSGFDNLTLTPTTVIELNPLPSNCELFICGCTDSLASNYDSLANINDSTCLYPVFFQQSFSICNGDSISVGGNIYNISGNYTDTLTSLDGYDSLVTTNLVINSTSSSNTTETSCDSYSWNGNIYNLSGTYSWVGSNINGCDSTATLNLTINSTSSSNTIETSCDSYSWNGNIYNLSGTYSWVGSNINGCDSTATLNLTINSTSSSNDTLSICFGDSVTFGGNTYNQTGIYTDTLTTLNGCDSIITTNLNVSQQISAIISQLGMDIKANSTGGNMPYVYEWNTGETIQQITPLVNGDYWVIITDVNSCESDTAFFTVAWLTTSIAEININNLTIYPNPSNGIFNIVFNSNTKQDIDLRVYNILGEVIFSDSLKDFNGDYNRSVDLSQYPNAVYILQLNTKDVIINKKLVLEK